MIFDRSHRSDLLAARASDWLEVCLINVVRQYPAYPLFIETGPAEYRDHKTLHPAFYGCFDWHSCVELHWVIVRLLRRHPNLPGAARARETLSGLLTADNLATELAFLQDGTHGWFERPYGWGWLLTLQHDLATWDAADGRRWANAVEPLARHIANGFVAWLPKLTYPVRTGVHPNTAFALSRSLDYAEHLSALGDTSLTEAIRTFAMRAYGTDTDYPARFEPSGSDFLSPSLVEAELMSRILSADEFPAWLDAFLPGLASEEPWTLFVPAEVSDPTDGQIAHLHGLNLSRAWAFSQLADRLPSGDPRIEPMLNAADRHTRTSLNQVAGSHYMVEHWLAAYAALLLS
jgi:hypothetical protein